MFAAAVVQQIAGVASCGSNVGVQHLQINVGVSLSQKTSEEQARLVFFFFCVTFSSFTAHPSSSSVFSSRRGSNVSLVLDMSALGSVEPMNAAVVTPREAAAREYLLSANRPLTRQQLQDLVNNTHKLQAEFAVSLV